MQKIVVVGDIHGRDVWKAILAKETPDKAIFLGDYVGSHDDIDARTQLNNLYDIFNFSGCEKVLLRGNHDMQHLRYYWAQCSGFDHCVADEMYDIKSKFLACTQWAYQEIIGEKKVIFSHAGISLAWMRGIIRVVDIEQPNWIDELNRICPSERFGFNGERGDIYGDSPMQPCTWIRPQSLIENWIDGYTQIVGHTPQDAVNEIKVNDNDSLWLCDSLAGGSYLVMENDNFIIKTIRNYCCPIKISALIFYCLSPSVAEPQAERIGGVREARGG